jgi:hypothetical protein
MSTFSQPLALSPLSNVLKAYHLPGLTDIGGLCIFKIISGAGDEMKLGRLPVSLLLI